MTMASIAVSLCWLMIYAIFLAGVIALVLYGIKTFIYKDLPPKLEQGVWFVFLLLFIIAAIGAVTGAVPISFPRWR